MSNRLLSEPTLPAGNVGESLRQGGSTNLSSMFPDFPTAGLAVWSLSMLALSPYDQLLSVWLSSPASVFGRFIQDWAAVPAYAAVSIALIAKFRDPNCVWARAILYQCLIHSLALTHLLKQFWGRVRPGDVLSSPELYSHFFVPSGPFLGESFPSGHVAATLVLAPLPLLYVKAGKYREGLISLACLSILWSATSYGRVLFGVHYPTDCLFSLGSGLLCAQIVVGRLEPARDCMKQRLSALK